MRSSGYFYFGVSSRSHSSRVSSRIFLAVDYESNTGSSVSGSHVVLLVLSFYNSENNYRIEYPCSLWRCGPILTIRLWSSLQFFLFKVKLIFLLYVFLSTDANMRLVPSLDFLGHKYLPES